MYLNCFALIYSCVVTVAAEQHISVSDGREGYQSKRIIAYIEELYTSKKSSMKNFFFSNFYHKIPMGSPVSGILAEIFISHLEQEYILSTNKNKYIHIRYRYPYVDDILFLYKGKKRQVHRFQQHINTIHITKRTKHNKLPRSNCNQKRKHKFKICRRPTITVSKIHKTSNHPTKHKYAYRL